MKFEDEVNELTAVPDKQSALLSPFGKERGDDAALPSEGMGRDDCRKDSSGTRLFPSECRSRPAVHHRDKIQYGFEDDT